MRDKKSYQDKVKTKVESWQEKYEDLKQRMQDFNLSDRSEYQERLQQMATKRKVAEQKLAELEEDSGKSWEKFKQVIDDTLSDLEAKYDQLTREMNEAVTDDSGKQVKREKDSIGWPEGQAKQREKDSEGWAEGYETATTN